MSDTGHLFVCHANLTLLACDAVVAPCDGAATFRRDWEQFMPEGTVPAYGEWIRLPSAALVDGHAALTGRKGTITQLVATYGFSDADLLVARVVEAVRRAARRVVKPAAGRLLPLIALPLVGTGAGGLAHRRGRVIERLLPALEKLAASQTFDVALVLYDARDHAAVQARRSPGVGHLELGGLTEEADRLGGLAASGALSLFVGSGVSIPLGVLSWLQLLQELDPARTVGPDDDLLAVAEEIKRAKDPMEYEAFMVSQFDRSQHTLGHALLAGLGVRQMVTTNYDPCLELALDRVHGTDGFRVMTRSLPEGTKPWLLKLHGDIVRPDRLVLTASDYKRLATDHRPLHGVVESLMMTSHLLFVGFGLRDDDYVELAKRVAATRDEADADSARPPVGTALTIAASSDDKVHHDGLTVLTMTDSADDVRAARRIEIFLDRVLMQATRSGVGATAYFLDDRFEEAFASDADVSLRRQLLSLAEDRSTLGSAGRASVDNLLLGLGIKPGALASEATSAAAGTAPPPGPV